MVWMRCGIFFCLSSLLLIDLFPTRKSRQFSRASLPSQKRTSAVLGNVGPYPRIGCNSRMNEVAIFEDCFLEVFEHFDLGESSLVKVEDNNC